MASEITNVSNQAGGPPVSRTQAVLKILAWSSFAILCLILFTLVKLPEVRLKNFVQGTIASALSARGISFVAGVTDISLGFGVKYTMKDVTLNFPPPQPSVKIDRIELSPSLAALVTGKMGGKLRVLNGDGVLKASFSIGGLSAEGGGGELSASFKADALDATKLGLLPAAAGVSGGFVIDGEGSVSGDMRIPTSLTGALRLKLSKIVLEQQSIGGFSVPRLGISEGGLEVSFEGGKALVRSFRLGKTGAADAADDITANVTGDIQLGKQWESSTMNLKTRFSLSQKLLKAFILIDALLADGKQGEGSYGYHLSGPFYSPTKTPLKGDN